jgi:hypothetical protein
VDRREEVFDSWERGEEENISVMIIPVSFR